MASTPQFDSRRDFVCTSKSNRSLSVGVSLLKRAGEGKFKTLSVGSPHDTKSMCETSRQGASAARATFPRLVRLIATTER